jgi:hypothetical protein
VHMSITLNSQIHGSSYARQQQTIPVVVLCFGTKYKASIQHIEPGNSPQVSPITAIPYKQELITVQNKFSTQLNKLKLLRLIAEIYTATTYRTNNNLHNIRSYFTLTLNH